MLQLAINTITKMNLTSINYDCTEETINTNPTTQEILKVLKTDKLLYYDYLKKTVSFRHNISIYSNQDDTPELIDSIAQFIDGNFVLRKGKKIKNPRRFFRIGTVEVNFY